MVTWANKIMSAWVLYLKPTPCCHTCNVSIQYPMDIITLCKCMITNFLVLELYTSSLGCLFYLYKQVHVLPLVLNFCKLRYKQMFFWGGDGVGFYVAPTLRLSNFIGRERPQVPLRALFQAHEQNHWPTIS